MADKFYEKEAKRMEKDKRFKFKFQDLINEIADRAQVLKLQGKNTGKASLQQTAKVAATSSVSQGSFRDAVRDSPPKQQGIIPSKQPSNQMRCRFCSQQHTTEGCTKLLAMNLQQRMDSLKKQGFCYRCLHKGHVARDCGMRQPPICKTCNLGHQSMLHTPNGVAIRPAQRDTTAPGTAPAQTGPTETEAQEATATA